VVFSHEMGGAGSSPDDNDMSYYSAFQLRHMEQERIERQRERVRAWERERQRPAREAAEAQQRQRDIKARRAARPPRIPINHLRLYDERIGRSERERFINEACAKEGREVGETVLVTPQLAHFINQSYSWTPGPTVMFDARMVNGLNEWVKPGEKLELFCFFFSRAEYVSYDSGHNVNLWLREKIPLWETALVELIAQRDDLIDYEVRPASERYEELMDAYGTFWEQESESVREGVEDAGLTPDDFRRFEEFPNFYAIVSQYRGRSF
jgi:hypothetical protein